MSLQTGQAIDVNCFAQSGASLLGSGTITATRTYQGQTSEFLLSSSLFVNNSRTQIRNLTFSLPGTYTFSCRNSSNTCNNQDQVTVAGTMPASPSPSPSVAVSPSPSPLPSAVASTPPSNTGVSCVDLTIADAYCPVPGQSVRFRCQGQPGADYYFFAYRRSPNSQFVELSRGSEPISAPLDVSEWTQVQCNACIGTTCSSSESVNQNCTVSIPSTTTGGISPADINRDGNVDINDYRDFLRAYLEWVQRRG